MDPVSRWCPPSSCCPEFEWSSFGSSCILQSYWRWCHKLCTPEFGCFAILLWRSFQALPAWMETLSGPPASCLKGSSQDSVWGQSRTALKLSLSPFCAVLAVSLRSMCCWKVKAGFQIWSLNVQSWFHQTRMCWLLVTVIVPGVQTPGAPSFTEESLPSDIQAQTVDLLGYTVLPTGL